MSIKKMGRPTDEVKPNAVHVRLSDEDIKILDDYCAKTGQNRQASIRDSIKYLKVKVGETQ